ncbi:MAG: hypothetical protein ABSB94_16105 [Syntrophorhabdales bacterium]|jgi:altronate dehydratase large subunit
MRDNMDMDVSKSPDGKEPVSGAGKRIFEEIATVASGKLRKAKKCFQRDFAIFKMNPDT